MTTQLQIGEVAFDETKLRPGLSRHQVPDFIEILGLASGKVIEAYDALVQLEKRFQQVRTNEPSHTSYEPGAGCQLQLGEQSFVRGHCEFVIFDRFGSSGDS